MNSIESVSPPGPSVTIRERLLVVICTFNELENLPQLVESLRQHLPGCQLLVIDDQSPDGTGVWATEESGRSDDLTCLVREGERGLGSAAITGLQWGLARGYGFLATLDADFSHDPADLALMVTTLKQDVAAGIGVVIGSRYVPGGRISGWPASRRWASRGLNLLSRLVLGLSAADCTGALRVYRAEALQQADLGSIRSRGFGYLEELLFVLVRAGVRIIEVPIAFQDRRAGKSKASLREALAAAGNLFRLRFTRRPACPTETRTTAPQVVSSPDRKDR